jgi:hypothetical protein
MEKVENSSKDGGFTMLKKRFLFINRLLEMLQKIKSHYRV